MHMGVAYIDFFTLQMPLGKCTGDGCNNCEGFIPCKDIPQCSNCGHKPASHENGMFLSIGHVSELVEIGIECNMWCNNQHSIWSPKTSQFSHTLHVLLTQLVNYKTTIQMWPCSFKL